MRWPDLPAHRPWKGESWQYFSPIFHSPCFQSEVAHTFYLAQTLLFSGFLCEFRQHVNLPESKSTRKTKTVLSAGLMNWTDSQDCLMSTREKARERAGLCGQETWMREGGPEVREGNREGRYRNKSSPLPWQQAVHFTRFFWKITWLLQTRKKKQFYFCITVAKSYTK